MNKRFVGAYFDTKSLSIKDKEKGILRGVIGSDETVDRYGEIVDSASWQLEHYSENPVVLWAHNLSFGEDRPTIARSIRTWIENKQLKFDLQFDMADEFAAGIYRKYTPDNGGPFLRMFSVGFIPHTVERISDDTRPNLRAVLKNNELLELSCVPVPANPNASSQLRMNSFLTRTWEDMLEEAVPVAKHLEALQRETAAPEEKTEEQKKIEKNEENIEALASRVATKVLPQLTKAITDVAIEAVKPKEEISGSSSEPTKPQLGGGTKTFARVLRGAAKELQGILTEVNSQLKASR